MIDTVVRRYNSWKKYRQTFSELSRLTDRELNDLGIARSDIGYFARSATR